MITWRQFFGFIAFLTIFAAIFLFSRVVHGYSPTQYYQASWVFKSDASGHLTATIDGFNYGRTAPGTYYNYPVSYLNPDQIFKNNFDSNSQSRPNATSLSQG